MRAVSRISKNLGSNANSTFNYAGSNVKPA